MPKWFLPTLAKKVTWIGLCWRHGPNSNQMTCLDWYEFTFVCIIFRSLDNWIPPRYCLDLAFAPPQHQHHHLMTPPQLQLRSTLLTPPKPYQLNRHPHHHSIGKRVSPLCQRKAPRPLHFVALERVVIWTQTYVPKNWKRYLVPIPTYIQRSLKSKSIHLTLPQNKD
jgi:hypothetical protein